MASHRGEIEVTLFALNSSADREGTPVLCRKVKSIYSAGLQDESCYDLCRLCVFVESYVHGLIHENPPKRTPTGKLHRKMTFHKMSMYVHQDDPLEGSPFVRSTPDILHN